MNLAYLIGAPGSGKTTLFSELTEGLRGEQAEATVPHVVWSGRGGVVVELGKRREDFGGTDALAMSIQPQAVEFLQSRAHHNIMAEGDRLANLKFFKAAVEAGYNLRVYYLDTPREILSDRRIARSLAGSPQNTTWVRGRDTKVKRLAQNWPVIRIPGELVLEEQIRIISTDPVIHKLLVPEVVSA